MAFVLNAEVNLDGLGRGINIEGFQSVSEDVSFVGDILPYVVKHLKIHNEEKGGPYRFLRFSYDRYSLTPVLDARVKAMGFVYNEMAGWYQLSLIPG